MPVPSGPVSTVCCVRITRRKSASFASTSLRARSGSAFRATTRRSAHRRRLDAPLVLRPPVPPLPEHVPAKCAHFADKNMLRHIESGAFSCRRSDSTSAENALRRSHISDRRRNMDIRKGQALRDLLKDKSLLKDKCYVDGKWIDGTASIEVTNPATADVIVSVPKLRHAETKAAVQAAATSH